MSYKVKTDQETCNLSRDYYIEEGKNMEELVQSYFSIMGHLLEMGVRSGSTCEALRAYVDGTENIKNKVIEITELLSRATEEFHAAVEDVDRLA